MSTLLIIAASFAAGLILGCAITRYAIQPIFDAEGGEPCK